MSVHMKKRLIELEIDGKKVKMTPSDKKAILSLVKRLEYSEGEASLVSSEEALKSSRQNRPRGAIYLKSKRLRENLSQEELENKTGISKTNISSYENGSRKITENVAKRLAKALKIKNYQKLLET